MKKFAISLLLVVLFPFAGWSFIATALVGLLGLIGAGAIGLGVANETFVYHARSMLQEHEREIEAYVNGHPKLASPSVAFINIDDYPETRDALGIQPDEKGPFAMLLEPYTFYDLDGSAVTIPAGMVFDGASVPDLAHYFIMGTSFDPTLLAPGLIHDYMYRNPDKYDKDYADMMIFVNAYLSRSPNPAEIWEGLYFGGGKAYDGHVARQREGQYMIFTDGYYKDNLDRYDQLHDRWTHGQLFDREGATISNQTWGLFIRDGGEDEGIDGGEDTGSVDLPGVDRPPEDLSDIADVIGDVVVEELGFDSFVGPELPHRRILFLFSGDLPSMKDAKQTVEGFVDLLNGDGDTLIGEGWDEAKKFLYSTKDEFENLRGVL